MNSDSPYGPVTLAIRAAILQCETDVRRLRDKLTWTWLERYTAQLSRREIKRCLAANLERLEELRWAESIAIETEGLRWIDATDIENRETAQGGAQ